MNRYANLIKDIDNFCLLSRAERVLGPYEIAGGRKIVIVIDENGNRKTISFPKFLYQKYHNIQLTPEDTVDHIDRDKHNNDINNLRVVPRAQHSADDTRRVKLLDLNCAMCNKSFQRSPRLIRDKSRKGKVSQFCSKVCAGKYSREVQLGLRQKLPVPEAPISEYYRNDKNISASIEYILEKYGH